MPTIIIDGIKTNYEVTGNGPPLLMYSPGGFDGSMDKWSSLGVYARIRLLKHLPKQYTCITFDRRETGDSGGRIERITWDHYVEQGKSLLDHLGFSKAHIIGGCMGVSSVLAFAVKYPELLISQVLFWPVGGAKFRIRGHDRFNIHLVLVREKGLQGVIDHVKNTKEGFGKDPRVGPWGPVIRSDIKFAEEYSKFDIENYNYIVKAMSRMLLDRDTAPGAEPEDLMRLTIPTLIIPGRDIAHSVSSARYLEECIPDSRYWNIDSDKQSENNVPKIILEFLGSVT